MTDIEAEKCAIFKWQSLKEKCDNKNIPFGLTVAQIKKLQQRKTCYYTGRYFSDNAQDKQSFDRIEPSKGYTNDNVVACCQNVNYCKSNMSYDDIEAMYMTLTALKGKIK